MNDKLTTFFAVAYILYNFIVLLIYRTDKDHAKKHKKRISEKRLILLALFGGGPGAFFGMKIFRHKTGHLKFRILVPLFAIVQIVLFFSCIIDIW